MKIAVVILAGGRGTRMGGKKPSRMLGEISLLDRAIAYASSLTNLCAVAVREAEQAEQVEISVIRDAADVEGPLGGLVSALRFARDAGASAALSIPVDMPFLPPDLAHRLAEVLPRTLAAIACSAGHLHPVCGLWRREALEAVPGYLASERRSLKGFAEMVGYAAVEWPVSPLDPFLNINSERDLSEAERLLASLRS